MVHTPTHLQTKRTSRLLIAVCMAVIAALPTLSGMDDAPMAISRSSEQSIPMPEIPPFLINAAKILQQDSSATKISVDHAETVIRNSFFHFTSPTEGLFQVKSHLDTDELNHILNLANSAVKGTNDTLMRLKHHIRTAPQNTNSFEATSSTGEDAETTAREIKVFLDKIGVLTTSAAEGNKKSLHTLTLLTAAIKEQLVFDPGVIKREDGSIEKRDGSIEGDVMWPLIPERWVSELKYSLDTDSKSNELAASAVPRARRTCCRRTQCWPFSRKSTKGE